MRQKLNKCCEMCQLKYLGPIIDVSTRWNSTNEMIKRAEYLRRPLRALCAQEKNLSSDRYRSVIVSGSNYTTYRRCLLNSTDPFFHFSLPLSILLSKLFILRNTGIPPRPFVTTLRSFKNIFAKATNTPPTTMWSLMTEARNSHQFTPREDQITTEKKKKMKWTYRC